MAYLALAAIIGLVLGLSLYRVNARSLSYDEGLSVYDAKDLGDNRWVRPLYYLGLRVWLIFFRSAGGVRAFSAVFACATVAATFYLGQELLDVKSAVLASLLLAVSPSLIRSAQEVRMYSLGLFLTVAGSLALICAGPVSPDRAFCAWALLRFLACITTPLVAALFPADAASVWLRYNSDRFALWHFSGWLLFAVILWAPFAFGLFRRSARFLSGWVARERPPTIFTFFELTIGQLLDALPQSAERTAPSIGKKLFLFMLCLLCAAGAVYGPYRAPAAHLLIAVFVPSGILALLSLRKGSLWVPRYLLFVAPYAALLLASGFAAAGREYPVFIAVAASIYAARIVFNLRKFYRTACIHDWKGAVEAIESKSKPGDLVVVYGRERAATALRFYLADEKKLYYLGGGPERHNEHVIPLRAMSLLNDIPSDVARIWFVHRRRGPIAPLRKYLRPRFPKQVVMQFTGLSVLCAAKKD